MVTICENKDCDLPGTLKCGKCKKLSLKIGRYCSAACQAACFDNHKIFHKIACDDQYTSIAWTVSLALNEVDKFNHHQIPSLDNDGTLSVYLLGCRDSSEREDSLSQFTKLYSILQCSIYPTLQQIKVFMSGLEITTGPLIRNDKVSIQYLCARGETVIKDVDFTHAIAVLLQPGLEVYLDSWEAAFQILLAKNALTITTGYSHQGSRLTNDGVFDERILKTFFCVNFLIPMTLNPASYSADVYCKNAFYICFRGRNLDAVPISKAELLKANHVAFLNMLMYVATEFEDNPTWSDRCRRILKAIEDGRCPFPADATIRQVDDFVMYSDY